MNNGSFSSVVESNNLVPEWLKEGQQIFVKESGNVKTYTIEFVSRSIIEATRHYPDRGSIHNTFYAKDIGKTVFFESEDANKEIGFLKRDEKYIPYLKDVLINNDVESKIDKEFIPDERLNDEKRKQLISGYINHNYSKSEEDAFRKSSNTVCFGRMDFDTVLTNFKHDVSEHFYVNVYISKKPDFTIKDCTGKNIWQIEAGLYERVPDYNTKNMNAIKIYEYYDSGKIVSWKSKIASMFYQKNKTTMSIRSIGVEYIHNLMLKRRFDTNGEYENEYIVGALSPSEGSYDSFLVKILEQRRHNHTLQDIIETIQAKQTNIIHDTDLSKNIVVQGCAGSGKTMVMLHRISVLLYNNYGTPHSEYKIITPNKIFDAHISELAEQIDLNRIERLTMEEFYLKILEVYDFRYNSNIRDILPDSYASSEFVKYVYSDDFIEKTKKIAESKMPTIIENSLAKLNVTKIVEFSSDFNFNIAPPKFCDSRKRYLEECMKYKDEILAKLFELNLLIRKINNIKDERERDIKNTEKLFNSNTSKATLKEIFNEDGPYVWIGGYLVRKQEEIKQEDPLSPSKRRFAEFRIKVSGNTPISTIKQQFADAGITKNDFQKAFLERKLDDRSYSSYREGVDKIIEDAREKKLNEELLRKSSNDVRIVINAIQEYGNAAERELKNPDTYSLFINSLSQIFGNGSDVNHYKFYFYTAALFCYFISKCVKNKSKIDLVRSKIGKYFFVDEGQDVSKNEYYLIDNFTNNQAVFNIFGDTNQLIYDGYGINDWDDLKSIKNFTVSTLDENFRNTEEITLFYNKRLKKADKAIGGINGKDVKILPTDDAVKEIKSHYDSTDDLRVGIICSGTELINCKNLLRDIFDIIVEKEVRKGKIALLSVEQSKGLEFEKVYVFEANMTYNEKYIAYTRALDELVVFE